MRKGRGDHWLWMLRDGEVRSLTVLCSHLSGAGLLALPGVGFTVREYGGGLEAPALDQRRLPARSLTVLPDAATWIPYLPDTCFSGPPLSKTAASWKR